MPHFFKLIPNNRRLTEISTCVVGARFFGTRKSWPRSVTESLTSSLFSYSFKKSVMALSLFSKPAIYTDALIQGEIGITSSKATQFIIGSLRAKNTVIISVYDPETKIAAVAHVDASWTPSYALRIIEEEIKKCGSGHLIVDLSTKKIKDNELLESIKIELTKRKNISLRSIQQSATLYINSKTGELYIDNGIYPDLYMMSRIFDRQIDIKRGLGRTFPLYIKFDLREKPESPNDGDINSLNYD